MASHHIVEKPFKPLPATCPQSVGTLPDQPAVKLRHAGCRGAGTRRKRKDMKIGKAGPVNQAQRGVMRRVALSRKPGNEIGTKDDIGPPPTGLVAESYHVPAKVAALHPL